MIQAYGENLLIKPLYNEKKSKIIIPGEEDKPIGWEVVSVGGQVMDISCGQRVYFNLYNSVKIDCNNETHLFISKAAVIAVSD